MRRLALALLAAPLFGQNDADPTRFNPIDVFGLEYADDPRVAPDGKSVVYVRSFMDIMKDRPRSNLWLITFAGPHRSLTTGMRNDSSPRWSPDGGRLAYLAAADGATQIRLRWMDSGETTQLAQLTQSPGNLAWSPDGDRLAFTMPVPRATEPFVKLPAKPKGAEWAEPAKVIDRLRWRADGRGELPNAVNHVFVLPADGGTPRQLTRGDHDAGGPLAWAADGRHIVFSSNRRDDAEYAPRDSEIWSVSLTGELEQLTDRRGPDGSPAVSPDGKWIAYTGYDDRYQGYQVTELYVMSREGGSARSLTGKLDRSVRSPQWSGDGKGVYFAFDDQGRTKIGYVSLTGEVETLCNDVGGTSLGRPYASGAFTVNRQGVVAYTKADTSSPADVGIVSRGKTSARHTKLNDDLLGAKELAQVDEIWFDSKDGRRIQGWIAKPPGFDRTKQYPLILEIHGGPFANYGARFSAEVQLFAAAGYVVLYTNPRGSTSYGGEFGNLIHHAYPGDDYHDLMAGVDAVIARGYVDPKRLYVTGGSGGGVLTSWIVGNTDRFKAAVVAKPVINWYSFVLTSDGASTFYKYWFPGFPWDHQAHYMKRSPISLVGNVATPTMLLTGEADYRTPMGESEQYYHALKLRKVDTALVRIPGASHGIASRPSRLISKVAHILEWFGRYDQPSRSQKSTSTGR